MTKGSDGDADLSLDALIKAAEEEVYNAEMRLRAAEQLYNEATRNLDRLMALKARQAQE